MRAAALALLASLVLVPASSAATPPSLATLLTRHVPILVLHPAEQFGPVRVDGFLRDSDLQRKTASGWETIAGALPAGGADLRLDQRACPAIKGPSAAPCYAAAEDAHGSEPVVYGKAFRTKTHIDLQYWIWYPYNDYSSTTPPGEVWQVHEGDWESVSVILDRGGRPLAVALSAHCKGSRRDWTRAPKRGLRPVVYVAVGSHANYFSPGVHPHSPVCWPPEARDIVRALALADRTGNGQTVRPSLVSVTAARPSWMAFAGTWGETGYLHFPNNSPVAYGAGPRGPAFHAQWRTPVTVAMSWPRG
ncbi:MAG TPA: Vps62-related protein [Gaiellaceae bacterium]|nr:Vps62-related protein [Gaiellaceae bacterium]